MNEIIKKEGENLGGGTGGSAEENRGVLAEPVGKSVKMKGVACVATL